MDFIANLGQANLSSIIQLEFLVLGRRCSGIGGPASSIYIIDVDVSSEFFKFDQ
jgi:hypothetical protein